MKAIVYTALIVLPLLLIASGKEKENPRIVRIWNENYEVLFESTEPEVLARIGMVFERAERVDNPKISKSLTYKIDFGERHQYDPDTGLYRLLSKTHQPVWRMLKEDLEYISSLVKKYAQKQAEVATP